MGSTRQRLRPLSALLAVALAAGAVASAGAGGQGGAQQAPVEPAAETAPNPYAPAPFRRVADWPDRRIMWGAAYHVQPDGKGAIWVVHRGSPPIVKLDIETGAMLSSFGQGMFAAAHGFDIDAAGNLYVTDCPGGRGADEAALKAGKSYQVFKFAPDGRLLMTLGKAGVSRPGRDTFMCPTDVAVAPNGDLFVTDGHDNTPTHYGDRVAKFRADGTFVEDIAQTGSGPGQVFEPHGIAIDSRGRLFIADRMNDRVQILDQEGGFIDIWKQFGRTGGIYIDRATDTLYVSDANSTERNHPGWPRGIRVASASNGAVRYFISGSEPEGVAGDARGNVYAAVTRGIVEKFEKLER